MVELTKEKFVDIMTHIQEQIDKDDKLTDLLVCEDTTGWITSAPHLVTDVVDLLTTIMDDQDEWIEWWLWEVSEDKSTANVYVDGMKYSILTPSDLYYLIRNELSLIEHQEPDTEDRSAEAGEGTIVVDDSAMNLSLYDIFTSSLSRYVESDN